MTDRFWDEYATCHVDSEGFRNGNYHIQNFSHISASKPLPQKGGIRFLFGCETEMDYEMNIGIFKQRIDEFDFIVIPTTHLHFSGFTIPSDCVSPRAKAEFWIKKLNALLDKDLQFHKIGIAHLTCGLMDRDRSRFLEMLELIDNEKLAAVLKKAAQRGAGIELNSDDM